MYFKVNNVVLNPNAGYSIKPELLSTSDSGRGLDGDMLRKVVSMKWDIELNFSFIPGDTMVKILNACNLMGDVELEFRNPLTNKQDKQSFYVPAPEITHKMTINEIFYYDLKLSFIQN